MNRIVAASGAFNAFGSILCMLIDMSLTWNLILRFIYHILIIISYRRLYIACSRVNYKVQS